MRHLLFAELLIALLLAAAALLLLLLLLRHRRGSWSSSKRPPPAELLPVSDPPAPTKKERVRQVLSQVLRRLCSRRLSGSLARVEPAASPDAQAEAQQQQPAEVGTGEEEVAAWRERWFAAAGQCASRALYTIDEDGESAAVKSEAGSVHQDQEEPETPFYTPPASPSRLIQHPPPVTSSSS
ncbi:hypothetical protein BRADI_2g61750v3 [Brachypodium distachyon]|uniref:Uncharacterized protein n=1 Tax=Brachypodium distachyon TaxID=15368 RepID=I1HVI1_BRADI|nr:hypothetical protein BRADI_2g61750v3 [Brachypodium distachyon]